MAEQALTVDDVKHRAEEVRDLAIREARKVAGSDPAKLVAAGVVGVLLVASLAYYLGSRRCAAGEPSGS